MQSLGTAKINTTEMARIKSYLPPPLLKPPSERERLSDCCDSQLEMHLVVLTRSRNQGGIVFFKRQRDFTGNANFREQLREAFRNDNWTQLTAKANVKHTLHEKNKTHKTANLF